MERILLKFTKTKTSKFISNLDTMRVLQRAFRRVRLPLSYSNGFNPHPTISIASPLSLGISSLAEYVDVDMDEEFDIEDAIQRLNDTLPDGMQVVSIINIKAKLKASMSAVEAAKYKVVLDSSGDEEEIKSVIEEIMNSKELIVLKKTKSGEKPSDIRPLIRDISLAKNEDGRAVLSCMLLSGSRGNLNPDLCANLIKERSGGMLTGFAQIERQELYTMDNEKLVTLEDFYASKGQAV